MTEKQTRKTQPVDFPDPDLAMALTEDSDAEILGEQPLFIKADGTVAKLKEAPKTNKSEG